MQACAARRFAENAEPPLKPVDSLANGNGGAKCY